MSNIDPTTPTEGQATTQSVRDNFQAAADEIDALQADAFDNHLQGYGSNAAIDVYTGDLDQIITNSCYYFVDTATSNFPNGYTGRGYIYTLSRTDNIKMQFMFGTQPASMYMRATAAADGTWLDWYEFGTPQPAQLPAILSRLDAIEAAIAAQ